MEQSKIIDTLETYQLAVELSVQPHLDNLVSATKYLVAKQYDNKGNGGKSKHNSFWVFVVVVTVATEK